MYHLHCDIIGSTRPQCDDVFKHLKTAVRQYHGNQFSEEFQSHCNLSTALELAGLFSDMCSRSDDMFAASERFGDLHELPCAASHSRFVPHCQEHCTCAAVRNRNHRVASVTLATLSPPALLHACSDRVCRREARSPR
jgi:hypothetical protein